MRAIIVSLGENLPRILRTKDWVVGEPEIEPVTTWWAPSADVRAGCGERFRPEIFNTESLTEASKCPYFHSCAKANRIRMRGQSGHM